MIQFDKSEIQIRILGILVSSIFFAYVITSLFYTSRSLGGSGFLDFINKDFSLFGLAHNISLVLVVLVIYVAFNYVLYLSTDEKRLANPDKKSILMLIFLAASGFSSCAQIPYLIDVLAGFILPVKFAPLWILPILSIELTIYALTPNTIMANLLSLQTKFAPSYVQLIFLPLTFLAIHCFLYFIGVLFAKEVRQHMALDKVHAELKATQKLYEHNVRNEERIYIARELHDTIGHSLAAISTNLQLAEKLCNNEAKEPIQDAYNVSKLLLSDVREIVSDLRKEDNVDLQDVIQTLIEPIKSPQITLKIDKNFNIKDPKISHVIFRCVQEIITNTLKHSKSKKLEICISKYNGTILFSSKDDGIGTSSISFGNGLMGMKERIEEIGGDINISSAPNIGFAIDIIIPIVEATYD